MQQTQVQGGSITSGSPTQTSTNNSQIQQGSIQSGRVLSQTNSIDEKNRQDIINKVNAINKANEEANKLAIEQATQKQELYNQYKSTADSLNYFQYIDFYKTIPSNIKEYFLTPEEVKTNSGITDTQISAYNTFQDELKASNDRLDELKRDIANEEYNIIDQSNQHNASGVQDAQARLYNYKNEAEKLGTYIVQVQNPQDGLYGGNPLDLTNKEIQEQIWSVNRAETKYEQSINPQVFNPTLIKSNDLPTSIDINKTTEAQERFYGFAKPQTTTTTDIPANILTIKLQEQNAQQQDEEKNRFNNFNNPLAQAYLNNPKPLPLSYNLDTNQGTKSINPVGMTVSQVLTTNGLKDVQSPSSIYYTPNYNYKTNNIGSDIIALATSIPTIAGTTTDYLIGKANNNYKAPVVTNEIPLKQTTSQIMTTSGLKDINNVNIVKGSPKSQITAGEFVNQYLQAAAMEVSGELLSSSKSFKEIKSLFSTDVILNEKQLSIKGINTFADLEPKQIITGTTEAGKTSTVMDLDITAKARLPSEGRIVKVSTQNPIQKILGLEPTEVYSGNPFLKEGTKVLNTVTLELETPITNYQKAINLLKDTGYTEEQAAAKLRFQNVKLVEPEFTGNMRVVYGDNTEILTKGNIEVPNKQVSANDFKTRSYQPTSQVFSSSSEIVGDIKGIEITKSNIELNNMKVSSDGGLYNDLSSQGKNSNILKQYSASKYIDAGEIKNPFTNEAYTTENAELYKQYSKTQAVNEGYISRGKVTDSTATIRIKEGNPIEINLDNINRPNGLDTGKNIITIEKEGVNNEFYLGKGGKTELELRPSNIAKNRANTVYQELTPQEFKDLRISTSKQGVYVRSDFSNVDDLDIIGVQKSNEIPIQKTEAKTLHELTHAETKDLFDFEAENNLPYNQRPSEIVAQDMEKLVNKEGLIELNPSKQIISESKPITFTTESEIKPIEKSQITITEQKKPFNDLINSANKQNEILQRDILNARVKELASKSVQDIVSAIKPEREVIKLADIKPLGSTNRFSDMSGMGSIASLSNQGKIESLGVNQGKIPTDFLKPTKESTKSDLTSTSRSSTNINAKVITSTSTDKAYSLGTSSGTININDEITKERQSPILVNNTSNISKVKEITIQQPKVNQVEIQKPVQTTTQVTIQVQPPVNPPQPTVTIIKTPPILKGSSESSFKNIKKLSKAYDVLVRKKGKILEVGKGLTYNEAIKLGVTKSKSSAIQTFALKEAGTTNKQDINYKLPSKLFTTPKQSKTNITNLTFVERRGQTITSNTELKDITSNKRKRIFK